MLNQPLSLSVDLGRAVLALAGALDLVGIDETGHGQRVALMADACAAELAWTTERRRFLALAALLHDCGVSTTREHRTLVNELDWSGSEAHCRRGEAYLSEVPVLASLAPVVRFHHTHWDRLPEAGLGRDLSEAANLIYLTDRIDALVAGGRATPAAAPAIAAKYVGTMFAPDLLAALDRAAGREAFWFSQEARVLHQHAARLVAEPGRAPLEMAEVKSLARMFGHIIDAKSPFTRRHSLGVAALSRHLGERAGLEGDTCDHLELAGLFHDIGKLRVPDEILEKPAPLDADERKLMARHAFDTWEILSEIFGDGPLCQWAAYHHEVLNGDGYPFHREGRDLSFAARIVAVADIFQALAQRRPYRDPMAPTVIVRTLKSLAAQGRLDGEVVALAADDLDACWQAAVAAED